MELKFCICGGLGLPALGSNRTFMELKLAIGAHAREGDLF